MKKVFMALIVLGIASALTLKIIGCGQGGGETPTNLSVSGTIYAVVKSGHINVNYPGFPSGEADVTDITVSAYSDSTMTSLITSQVVDCSNAIAIANYSLEGFSGNSTYYVKATQNITYVSTGTVFYNNGTRALTFAADNLANQNITLIPNTTP